MNPFGAVLFILCSISLSLVREKNSAKYKNTGRVIGLSIMIFSIIILGSRINGLNILRIDQILYANDLKGNRMALNSVFCFLLVGLSLLTIDNKNTDKYRISQKTALIAFLSSLLPVIGYLYESRLFYRLIGHIPMPFNNAVTFCALTMAIIISRSKIGFISVVMQKNIGGLILRRFLPLSIAVPIIIGWLRIEGNKAHLFDPEFGSALEAITIVSIFSIFIWWLSRSLNKADELREAYHRELIAAKKIAEDAKMMQEQFLANMSHEIRTPINGIQGMTDLILDTELNKEQRDFAATIKRSADNLLVIVNDILDFSKIQAGKLTIEKIDFNLSEVLDNIEAFFKVSLNEKNLALQIKVEQDVPSRINGDPYRLNQMLVNLVGNAIKFTHAGGIDIKVAIQNKTNEEIILKISVSDTGVGIPSDKINKVFESFTQATAGTTRKYGGTGLGLAITKQLLEMQNGSISVESKINHGTTFSMSIPYSYTKSTAPANVVLKGLTNYRSLLIGKKFLIAEDNEVNQKVISNVLQKVGGTVDIANNGLEAISFLKKSNDYNLIIMDLQMPEMDGYSATKYIRNVMKLPTPIIAMTASNLKGEKSKCLEMGMNAYVTKPFDFTFIYNMISTLLGDNPITNPINANPVTTKSSIQKLFDLSLLEEMEDNEYLSDVLGIFLSKTPDELNKLQEACTSDQFDIVYSIAHKLKSSAGLLQAELYMVVLIKIEEAAKANNPCGLMNLYKELHEEYKKIETPLQIHLTSIKTKLNLAV